MLLRSAVVVCALVAPAAAAPLREVSFHVTGVCAVDSAGGVRCDESGAVPVGTGPVRAQDGWYVVTDDGALVYTYGGQARHEKTPFPARDITSSESRPCLLGAKGELACRDRAGTFVRLEKSTTFVEVATEGSSFWALDKSGGLWCQGRGNCARIRIALDQAKSPASLTSAAVVTAYARHASTVSYPDEVALWRVATGVKRFYAAGAVCVQYAKSADALTCWGWLFEPTKVSLPAGDEVTVTVGHLCARTGDAISCTWLRPGGALPPGPPEVATTVVRGARRMWGGEYRFCVESEGGEVSCSEGLAGDITKLARVTWAKAAARTE